MECHLCDTKELYRQAIRDHVLKHHKDERVYQCNKCDFITSDLRESMVDHMIVDHDVDHPLCENVDFQHLATGELIKRMTFDAPDADDSSDDESIYSEMQYSPESGVEIPDTASDSSRSQTPQLTAPTVGPTDFSESENPEGSPDSGYDPVLTPSSSQNPEKDRIPEPVVATVPNAAKSISMTLIPDEFECGQVVWVWISGYPIWPGMIVPAPDSDKLVGMHKHVGPPHVGPNNVGPRLKYHCQFFGTSAERSWVRVNAILPWVGDRSPMMQFEEYTKALIVRMNKSSKKNGRKKGKETIKSSIPKGRQKSFDVALDEAQDAFKGYSTNEDRCNKLQFDYSGKTKRKSLDSIDRPKAKPKNNHRRKSILPPSTNIHITPYKDLEYRESPSSRIDPDLYIPEDLYEQKDKTIPAEIVPGPELYEYNSKMIYSQRKLSKDVLERALLTFKTKVTESQLRSPKKKDIVKPEIEWSGTKGGDEVVCAACEEEEYHGQKPIQCSGPCQLYYHPKCADIDVEKETNFTCRYCQARNWECFACHNNEQTTDNPIIKCGDSSCGRHYHKRCLLSHKFSSCLDKDNPKCPHHTCHSCASKSSTKNSKDYKTTYESKGKMFKCVRCPAAYHFYGEKGTKSTKNDAECIPAGSILLAGRNIICPAHFQPRNGRAIHKQIHVNQCFTCFQGGDLSICDSCPLAYHDACLEQVPSSDGAWYCKKCSTGIPILYRDLVWVKMSGYRWWPSEVTHPTEIPEKLERMAHSVGEFVVRFLGTQEYYWVNKRRCFHYTGIIADPVSIQYYNNTKLYKTDPEKGSSQDAAKVEITGKEKHFKSALIEAEEYFDKICGIKKANGGSLPFHKVSVNTYHSDFPADLKKKIKRELTEEFGSASDIECECHKRNQNCDSGLCENRSVQVECAATCKSTNCQNRRFSKRVYPQLHKFKTWWGGYGLEAKQFIPAGTFIIEYVGEIIDIAEAGRRLEESAKSGVTNYYILSLDKDRMIDAGPRGNWARFINHSCNPNCSTEPWIVNGDRRVGIFASKDINPKEELTFNYQLEQKGTAKTKCLCGAEKCAGYIGDKTQQQQKAQDTKAGKKKNKKKSQITQKSKMKPLSVLKMEEKDSKKRRVSNPTSSVSKKRKIAD